MTKISNITLSVHEYLKPSDIIKDKNYIIGISDWFYIFNLIVLTFGLMGFFGLIHFKK